MAENIVLYKYKHRDLYCAVFGGKLHFVSEKRMEDYLKVRKQVPALAICVAAGELNDRISECIREQEGSKKSAEEVLEAMKA